MKDRTTAGTILIATALYGEYWRRRSLRPHKYFWHEGYLRVGISFGLDRIYLYLKEWIYFLQKWHKSLPYSLQTSSYWGCCSYQWVQASCHGVRAGVSMHRSLKSSLTLPLKRNSIYGDGWNQWNESDQIRWKILPQVTRVNDFDRYSR